ncbi:cysteine-rich receptor-like protein kinase 10 [Phragmites australis]|uniref:cysteine-rich receptor-like protein kinase 10 n=1 Tax=Phragmites australis TaxID=29695 RepID=UPI002D77DAA2|nr:cysteine-rich receptor-like protein kinase 10 [Phragmites australis]
MAGVLLIIIGVLLMAPSAAATAAVCGNGSNYTANGTYQSNLAFLAATLPINASSSPQLFATATAGQAPNMVYALALCRGDITNVTACSACVADSFQYAQQMCPFHKGAAVYYDDCLLGFSGNNILAPSNNITQDNSTLFQYWNQQTIAGDPALVTADVRELLTQTAQEAAGTARRFATTFMDASSSAIPTLYSLAQCTPDLSAADCLACLQRIIGLVNATTSVRVGGRILLLRCNIRFEAFMFYYGQPMKRITPSSIAPAPPVPAPTTNKRLGSRPWVITLFVAPPLAVVAFCFIFYCRWRRRRYRKGKVRLGEKRTNNLQGGDELDWEMEAELSEFSVFDFHQIVEATSNFSEENKLGEGGFGPVYKGQFPEGTEIAVKRLASHSGQGFVEFKNEVQLIAKLQHSNLVRLLGCCSQGEEKILVYEYLPNKSLDFFIFDETRKALLDWNKRLAIIEGIAEGLLYLHKHSRLRVIHRDLKPSNILLDNEMNPKISDFGLAKIFSSNNIEGTTTTRVVGTYGYMAPEYASGGLFSIKSDVFSFGVIILEILSGKRNSGSHQCGDFINLLGYAWQLWDEGRWTELVDASLVPKSYSTEMTRCINIALLCVQENAADRPTMLDAVAMLSSKTKILEEPKHPPYFNLRVGNEEASTATKSCSINDMAISVTARR